MDEVGSLHNLNIEEKMSIPCTKYAVYQLEDRRPSGYLARQVLGTGYTLLRGRCLYQPCVFHSEHVWFELYAKNERKPYLIQWNTQQIVFLQAELKNSNL